MDGEVAELLFGTESSTSFHVVQVMSLPAAQMPHESRGVTHPLHIDVLPCAFPAGNYLQWAMNPAAVGYVELFMGRKGSHSISNFMHE